MCFGTIRNNTALKHTNQLAMLDEGFGTIRNNTALKPASSPFSRTCCFGTIRNNTALKQKEFLELLPELFWNHSKQHSSKTHRM